MGAQSALQLLSCHKSKVVLFKHLCRIETHYTSEVG